MQMEETDSLVVSESSGTGFALDRSALRSCFSSLVLEQSGKVVNVLGNIVEASVPPSCKLGALVEIVPCGSKHGVFGEIVGFRDERALVLPYRDLAGVGPGSVVHRRSHAVSVSDSLLGKVVDAFLVPLELQTAPDLNKHGNDIKIELDRMPLNPMQRQRITKPLSLGVRAIDAALTFGDGQRIGIMAGSGVGKSVLLGMIARSSDADVNIIGLIGERGREVREFLERDLGVEGMRKSIVVAVTSDHSPLMKVRAAKLVHTLAEYFSSQGKRVLLMMDSLTRMAMAQREIGLSVGEPPTTKGYTPSVFSLLPRILERSGPQAPGSGAISALYTVLVDGDDFNDPIADAARSILDGQINLTRRLASKGHFPAIDISSSISRVMLDIVDEKHRKLALKLKSLIGVYEENFDLVQIGAYQNGANPMLDEAIRLMPAIEEFLKQDIDDQSSLSRAVADLEKLFRG